MNRSQAQLARMDNATLGAVAQITGATIDALCDGRQITADVNLRAVADLLSECAARLESL